MSDHDNRGRFKKGNKAAVGHGRRPRSTEEEYLASFCHGVSLKDWEAATKAVLEKALKGDVSAWTALAKYAMGQPVHRIEGELDLGIMTLSTWRKQAKDRRERVEES